MKRWPASAAPLGCPASAWTTVWTSPTLGLRCFRVGCRCQAQPTSAHTASAGPAGAALAPPQFCGGRQRRRRCPPLGAGRLLDASSRHSSSAVLPSTPHASDPWPPALPGLQAWLTWRSCRWLAASWSPPWACAALRASRACAASACRPATPSRGQGGAGPGGGAARHSRCYDSSGTGGGVPLCSKRRRPVQPTASTLGLPPSRAWPAPQRPVCAACAAPAGGAGPRLVRQRGRRRRRGPLPLHRPARAQPGPHPGELARGLAGSSEGRFCCLAPAKPLGEAGSRTRVGKRRLAGQGQHHGTAPTKSSGPACSTGAHSLRTLACPAVSAAGRIRMGCVCWMGHVQNSMLPGWCAVGRLATPGWPT